MSSEKKTQARDNEYARKAHPTLEMGTPDRANLTRGTFPVAHCVSARISTCTFAWCALAIMMAASCVRFDTAYSSVNYSKRAGRDLCIASICASVCFVQFR